MSNSPRIAVSAAAMLTVALVVVGGVSVIILYPSLAGSSASTGSSTTKALTGSTTFATSTLNSSTTYTATGFPPPSNGSSAWDVGAVANITLNYNRTQEYIHDAYNYSFFASETGSNPVLISAIISSYGPLILRGNWTTGYNMTFAYDSVLNVTVQYTPPAFYQIVRFWVQNYTLGYWLLTYNSTQQKAISAALSDGTVRSYLAESPSYPDGVFLFPSGNKTFGGDYLILFDQTAGAKILGVFVDLDSGSVVATYSDVRTSTNCIGNGFCYTSPWGS